MNRFLRILIIVGLAFLWFPGTASAHTAEEPFVTDLIAGGGNEASAMDVGDVLVWNDGSFLYVKYALADSEWCITETHLQIATVLSAIPQKNGNPIPGKFIYSNDHPCISSWVYKVPITWGVGTEVLVAAHAVVEKSGGLTGFEMMLPDQVSMVVYFPGVTYGAPSYFDVMVGGGTILDGMHDGWCVDVHAGLGFTLPYTSLVFSSYSYEGLPVGRVAIPTNFDLVNYVLNRHYVGQVSPSGGLYTFGDVQRAIWWLVEGSDCNGCFTGPWAQSHVDEILTDAYLYGEGYEPSCGGVLAIILEPSSVWGQILIIEVPAPCGEDVYETAWGDGFDFPGANWATYFKYIIQ